MAVNTHLQILFKIPNAALQAYGSLGIGLHVEVVPHDGIVTVVIYKGLEHDTHHSTDPSASTTSEMARKTSPSSVDIPEK